MSSLFPFEFPISWSGDEPLLADIDDDEAGEVINALSSDTARNLLARLYDEPAPASKLAESTDTSIQNVQYHLGKLSDAGLIQIVDSWYSKRGREMAVYAPTREGVVLFAGRDKEKTLRTLLSRLLGAVGIIGVIVSTLSIIKRNGSSIPRGSSSPGTSGGRRTTSKSPAQTTQAHTRQFGTSHVSTTHGGTTTPMTTHLTTAVPGHPGFAGLPIGAWVWLTIAVVAIGLGYYLLTTQ